MPVSGFRFDGIELGSAYRTWHAVVVESRVKKLNVNKCPQRFGLLLRHTGFCLITLKRCGVSVKKFENLNEPNKCVFWTER